MLLALLMVLTIGILTQPVRSVVRDDLGEQYTESLGYVFWEIWKKRGVRRENVGEKEKSESEGKSKHVSTSTNSSDTVNFQHQRPFH